MFLDFFNNCFPKINLPKFIKLNFILHFQTLIKLLYVLTDRRGFYKISLGNSDYRYLRGRLHKINGLLQNTLLFLSAHNSTNLHFLNSRDRHKLSFNMYEIQKKALIFPHSNALLIRMLYLILE